MEETMTFTIETEEAGQRVDAFLANACEDFSRSAIQKWIGSGLVQVDCKPVKANYKLRAGDFLKMTVPEIKEVEIMPENIPLDILYEDDDLIVVNKPKGMVVHPAAGHTSGTLVNALMYHCGDSLSGINGELRPGIVHRIDKDTSGVLMVAKNDKTHRALAEQLAVHSITRKYRAIVMNGFSEEKGTVDAPIGRNSLDRKKMAVTPKHSRHAVTHWRVLEKFGQLNLIEAQLETGRTHQIRVHMAYIGHPLLGDTVYGAKKQPFQTEGQVLHAMVLGFIHPTSGEYMEFEAPLPAYFAALLERLRSMHH